MEYCAKLDEAKIKGCLQERGYLARPLLHRGCSTSFFPFCLIEDKKDPKCDQKIVKIILTKRPDNGEPLLLYGKSMFQREIFFNGLVNSDLPYAAPQLYEDASFVCNDYAFLVMDRYDDNMTTRAKEQANQIPLLQSLPLPVLLLSEPQFLQMAKLVRLISKRYVVHGNLKLDKFLLRKKDEMVVTGFSLSGFTERPAEFPAVLGWQPFGSTRDDSDLAANTLPIQDPMFQKYFNSFQLLLSLQQTNLFATLIYKPSEKQLYYLDADVTKTFPKIPKAAIEKLCKYFYGEAASTSLPTTKQYQETIATLQAKVAMSPYIAPVVGKKQDVTPIAIEPLEPLPPLSSESTASPSPNIPAYSWLFRETPPPAEKTPIAEIPAPRTVEVKKTPIAVIPAPTGGLPCELQGYTGYANGRITVSGRYRYIVLRSEDGEKKRFVFRQLIKKPEKLAKWKPIAFSKLSRKLQRQIFQRQ